MANVTVRTQSSVESRGESMTVKEALDYISNLKASENEEGEPVIMSAQETAELAIVYAARRMMALNKDQKRINAGKAPTRIYVPRVAPVKGAKKAAGKHRAEAKDLLAKDLGIKLAKPAAAQA